MHTIKFDHKLVDYVTGSVIERAVLDIDEHGKEYVKSRFNLTVRKACLAAMNYRAQGQELSLEEHHKRSEVVKKLLQDKPQLNALDIGVIVELARKHYSGDTLVFMQIEEELGATKLPVPTEGSAT